MADDGSSVQAQAADLGVSTIAVPAVARRYLAAQHLFRMATGADDSQVFVSGDTKRRTPSPTSIGRYILNISRLSGLALKSRRLEGDRSEDHWTHRFGLSIQVLES